MSENELTDIKNIILKNEMPDYKTISKNGFLEVLINKNTESGIIAIQIKTKDKEKQEYIDYLIKQINTHTEDLTQLYRFSMLNREHIEAKKKIIIKLQKILEDL
jgi:hypothetical protein